MNSSKRFDAIIAMNLLGLAVMTSAYGISVCNSVSAINASLLNKPSVKLVPMPEVIEYASVESALAANESDTIQPCDMGRD